MKSVLSYAQSRSFNTDTQLSGGVRSLFLGLSLRLVPHDVYASKEASDETTYMRRLV